MHPIPFAVGCIPNKVLAMAWDVMRGGHGASAVVRTDWKQPWSPKRKYWSKPVGHGTRPLVGLSSGNGS